MPGVGGLIISMFALHVGEFLDSIDSVHISSILLIGDDR